MLICMQKWTLLGAESGDSSVVTRWTIDQEVVGSNPTHGNLISVVRSLFGFTQPIRQNEYRLSVAGHIELGLKIRVYVLR